jgi:hypothetical protein
VDDVPVAYDVLHKLTAAMYLPVVDNLVTKLAEPEYDQVLRFLHLKPVKSKEVSPGLDGLEKGSLKVWGPLLSYLFIHEIGYIAGVSQPAEVSRSWIDEWLLGKIITRALMDLGLDEGEAWSDVSLVKIMTAHQGWWKPADEKSEALDPYTLLQTWLKDSEIQRWIGVNRYQGILWYNKESFEALVWWFFVGAILDILAEGPVGHDRSPEAEAQIMQRIDRSFALVQRLLEAEAASAYQLDKLLDGAM